MATLGTSLATAQTEEPISISPSSGEEGTAISVSGANCDGLTVRAILLQGETGLDVFDAVVNPVDGSWSGELNVPDPDDDSLVGEELGIVANCMGGDTTYAPATFSVTGPGQNTTTSSTTQTTPTSPTTDPGTSPTTSPGGGTGPTTTAPGGGGTVTVSITVPGSTPASSTTPAAPSAPAVNGTPDNIG